MNKRTRGEDGLFDWLAGIEKDMKSVKQGSRECVQVLLMLQRKREEDGVAFFTAFSLHT